MQQRTYFFPVFLVTICFILLVIFAGQSGIFGFFTNSVQSIFFPLGAWSHAKTAVSSKEEALQKENDQLREELAAKSTLEADNKALRDQFETLSPSSKNLLPVAVVGMPSVIPNVSFPEAMIIHAGLDDGISVGSVVVYKNQLVGTVTSLQSHFATVTLLTAKKSSLAIKDQASQAPGVLKGQGSGELIVDNVLLSDTITVGDTIVTMGGQNESGKGMLPDLIVGKVISIEKNPSNLFQKARLEIGVPLNRLTTVFVIK